MNRLSSILFFLLAIISFLCWQRERTQRQLLEGKVAELSVGSRQSIKSYGTDVKGVAMPRPSPSEAAISVPTAIEESIEQDTVRHTDESSPLSETALYGVESRVAAIGKMVPLSPEQTERLRSKYTAEARARKTGAQSDTESLESIIGDSNAQFYKEQVRNAFQRAHDQELDRDIFYLSRKLNFSPEQESAIRKLMEESDTHVENKFRAERDSPQFQNDPAFRVRLMIKENQFQSDWLAQQIKGILSPDQYQAYIQEEAESSSADMGLMHAP